MTGGSERTCRSHSYRRQRARRGRWWRPISPSACAWKRSWSGEYAAYCDLERANKELETFAYSVSHDLRAPLRAVDGFSKALLDDYWEELGDQGRHYLERLRAGAVRMGNLIDEILQLSRLSRHPFARAPVDMSALASDVIAELNTAEPDRRVQVEIQDGLLAEADPGLAQTVLHNLLANAYKFTAKTTHPWIRFGAVEQGGVPVYFVADNGAGFDMAQPGPAVSPVSPASPRERVSGRRDRPGDGSAGCSSSRRRNLGAGRRERGRNVSLHPHAWCASAAIRRTGEDVIPNWQPTDPRGADVNDAPAVLLVEDDRDDEELTLRSLGGAHPVEVARDGQEAVDYLFGTEEQAAKRVPAVVLLDLKLPRVGGLEVLKRISPRAHPPRAGRDPD